MGILKEVKVSVANIHLRKDECEVTFAKHGHHHAFLSISMSQEEALKYKIDAEYIVQLRDVEGQLEPHVIDHQPKKE